MSFETSLDPASVRRIRESLDEVGHDLHAVRGARLASHPVHAVYGGADRFRADVAAKFGRVALATLDAFAPDGAAIDRVFGTTEGSVLRARVCDKLSSAPVEDFRIDFEDGYGFRPDTEEDDHVLAAAGELADGLSAGTLPRWTGFRIKPLTAEHRDRAIRTLDGFVTALVRRTAGTLPAGFAVTLPKVTTPAQPEALAGLLDGLERAHGLAGGTIRVELLIESPDVAVDAEGRNAIPALLRALGGRARSIHLGAYDYQSVLGVTAPHQGLTHPACDHLRLAMLQAAGPAGVTVVDGATNAMPIPPHRGDPLTDAQRRENETIVHRAWREHYRNVRHAIRFGIHAGWDLHPAQLVARYVAVYADVLEGIDDAARRLRNFVADSARATRVGSDFDDAATAQGLVNFFVQAVDCGAITAEEASERTGLAADALRARSFKAIVDARLRH